MPASVKPPLVSELQYFSRICAQAIGRVKPENLFFFSIQNINQIHRDALLNTSVLLDTLPLGENCATVLSTSIRKSPFNQLSIRLMYQKDTGVKYALLYYLNNFGQAQYYLVVQQTKFRKLYQYAIRTGRNNLKLEPPVLYDNVIDKINDLVMGVKKDRVFKDYGIRLNRGLIFYGPPGNGKTFASRYIQQLCAKHLIPCGVYKTVDIEVAYKENRLAHVFNVAHVQIFDDVDINLFVRRGANTVTSSILSAMDGVTTSQKACLRFFTTNEDIDSMDYAFLRPGRIDTCVKIDKPDQKLTAIFWERWKKKPKELVVEKLVKASADMSFAQMEFLKIILVQNFQQNKQWDITKAVEMLKASYSRRRGKNAGFRPDTCVEE
jgi:hypothetical protein